MLIGFNLLKHILQYYSGWNMAKYYSVAGKTWRWKSLYS